MWWSVVLVLGLDNIYLVRFQVFGCFDRCVAIMTMWHTISSTGSEYIILWGLGMDSEIAFTPLGDAVDDRLTVTELLTEVENVQDGFVFDCSLVDY